MPPTPPKKQNPLKAAWNHGPWAKVGLIVSALIVCCMLCSVCGTIGSTIITAAATNRALQQTPAAPRATSTPRATATPVATLTAAQRLAQAQTDLQAIVKANTTAKVETVGVYADNSAEININIGTQLDEASAVTRCKSEAFALLQAVYTKWHTRPAQLITVWLYVRGPATDKYGNDKPDDTYAAIALRPVTASKIVWANLTPDRAWQVYDVTLLAPYLQGH